jgi:hypothetical protein
VLLPEAASTRKRLLNLASPASPAIRACSMCV